MGPRWRVKASAAKALSDPMSKIVSQLRSSLIQSTACGLLAGCSELPAAAEADKTELTIRACFRRPVITADKDNQWVELGMEEAFYLCHYLNCLRIVGKDNCVIDTVALWLHMKSQKAIFPELYKAYSHLRMKGSQYGVDFVAYRHHPSLVHSEYAVLVLSEGDGRLRIWSGVYCTIRLCGSVAKTLLVLRIDRNGRGAYCPSVLEGYHVEERTMTRWIPEQSRENQTTTENVRMKV